MTKVCTKCKINKSLEDYYKDKSKKDNKQSHCKTCTNSERKKFYVKNKENFLEYQKNYNTEHRKEIIEYKRKNKQKILANNAKYFKTDKGKLARVKVRHNRRSKEKEILNTLTLKEKNHILLILQNNKCPCCKKSFNDKLKPTLDHIIPLSGGGPLAKENVQYLCQSCNSRKHTQIIDYRTDIHRENLKLM